MNKTNKEKTLLIAEKKVPVNFSINYFFKYFKDKTGIDLLSGSNVKVDDSDTFQIFDYLSALLFAGNNAYHSKYNKEGALTDKEATDLVYNMEPVNALQLLNECSEVLRGDDEKNATPQAAKKRR